MNVELINMPWSEYVAQKPEESMFQWIVDHVGVKWDQDYLGLGHNHLMGFHTKKYGVCRAERVEDFASVTVLVPSPAGTGKTESPDKDSFCYEFYDLAQFVSKSEPVYDFQKTIDFMLRWRFDRVGVLWQVETYQSVVFTVRDLWYYLDDFADHFTYFGIEGNFLPAEIYLERINEETGNSIKRNGSRAFWGKGDSGRLDEINQHLTRMDTYVALEKNDDGKHIYRPGVAEGDLVALAYSQLYEKLISMDNNQLRRCHQCHKTFDPPTSRSNFCLPACMKKNSNRRYYARKKQNAAWMEKRRERGSRAAKKFRDSLT